MRFGSKLIEIQWCEGKAVTFVIKSMCFDVGQIWVQILSLTPTGVWLWKSYPNPLNFSFLIYLNPNKCIIRNMFGYMNKKHLSELLGIYFSDLTTPGLDHPRASKAIKECCLGSGSLCRSALISLAWRPLSSCLLPHGCKTAAVPPSSNQHFTHGKGKGCTLLWSSHSIVSAIGR